MATVPMNAEALKGRFEQLADTWEAETMYLSSTTKTMEHPAFREIVGMGEAVIPFVLRRMEEQRAHWDLGMFEISGEMPYPPSAAGKISLIQRACFDWAWEKGYSW